MASDTVNPRPLHYASGRAQITREGDGLLVVFPQRKSAADFWLGASALAALSAGFLAWTFWPGGATRVGGGTFTHPGDLGTRAVCLAVAAWSAAALWGDLRDRLIRSTLRLQGTTLAYRTPSLWGARETSYDLTHYLDVDVVGSDDGESIYLWLRRRDDAPRCAPVREIATRPPSEAAKADLEMVADALREAVWPERAAARSRKSTFTRTGRDAIESDKGFAVRLPEPGRVEYSQHGRTMSLRVERGWSPDHAMCFVIGRDDLSRWDGGRDATLPPATQREIFHNLGEALREWEVRLLVRETGTVPPSPGGPGEASG